MDKERALTLLRAHKAILVQRFGVVAIARFSDQPLAMKPHPVAMSIFWFTLPARQTGNVTSVCNSTWKT
jgi:hypothetical protein